MLSAVLKLFETEFMFSVQWMSSLVNIVHVINCGCHSKHKEGRVLE